VSALSALCGIILHPAGHTRSPAMHNAAYAALGIDAYYATFDVPESRLDEAIRGVRALGLRQLSVSIPHKVRILDLVDAVDETAARIGAANTIVRDGDRLCASNTDWLGAVRALEAVRPLKGARSVVLGAGGTARAVVWGLLSRGARVSVLNRSVPRAELLASELGAERAGPLEALADLPHDVLVNTTSVGMEEDVSPVPARAIDAEAVVLDAVYAPEWTRLLRDARARGARTVSGRWMLVHQAVAQLEAWAGHIDRKVAERVMGEAFGPQPA
jgi:shikimate dehydrogenase